MESFSVILVCVKLRCIAISSHLISLYLFKKPNKQQRTNKDNNKGKICTVGAVLIWIGKLFQTLGAAMEKARSPLDFNLDLGIVNKLWLANPRVLTG